MLQSSKDRRRRRIETRTRRHFGGLYGGEVGSEKVCGLRTELFDIRKGGLACSGGLNCISMSSTSMQISIALGNGRS